MSVTVGLCHRGATFHGVPALYCSTVSFTHNYEQNIT